MRACVASGRLVPGGILEIIDMRKLVREQRENLKSEDLKTPTESVYRPADPLIAAHIGLDDPG